MESHLSCYPCNKCIHTIYFYFYRFDLCLLYLMHLIVLRKEINSGCFQILWNFIEMFPGTLKLFMYLNKKKKKKKPKAKFLLWAWRWHIWKCMLFLRECRLNNIEHKQSNYKVNFWEMGHWKFLWNDKQDDIFIILGRTNMGRKNYF